MHACRKHTALPKGHEVLHNDDTSMRVLALRRAIAEEAGERTGIFTSGVVSTAEGRRIALFFTGRQHAGENLADVLKRRAAELPMPIQMSDALSRNVTQTHQVVGCLLPRAWKAAICSDNS